MPGELLDDKTSIYVNPTGRFVTGGPHGDAGLTGRKIIVDTYGGMAPHGGGAFSGKDPDQGRPFGIVYGSLHRKELRRGRASEPRSSAAGVCDRSGRPRVSVLVETFGTGKVEESKLSEIVREHFQLTPKGIIESLDLRRPIYQKTAAFGHFGRTEPEMSWERPDKVGRTPRRGRTLDACDRALSVHGPRPSCRRPRTSQVLTLRSRYAGRARQTAGLVPRPRASAPTYQRFRWLQRCSS